MIGIVNWTALAYVFFFFLVSIQCSNKCFINIQTETESEPDTELIIYIAEIGGKS